MNSEVKTIVIIVASPLNEDVLKRIGFHYFKKKMNVIIFDCLPWARKKIILNNFQIFSVNLFIIKNQYDFKKKLASIKCDYLIDFIGFHKHTRFIQGCCKSNNILFISQSLYPIPTPIVRSSVFKSLINSPGATINKIYYYLIRFFFNQMPYNPDISLLVGDSSINHLNINSKHLIFTTSQSWYDLNALKELSLEKKVYQKKYILFIDDCISQSIDFVLTNQKSIISSSEYYVLLDNFFVKIEKEFGIPVIIAGHPNGKHIEKYSSFFNKRDLFFDSTAALTINAEMILTHYSTAINYAVLSYKRIILMNFDKLKKSYQGLILQNIGKILNCKIIEIDKPLTFSMESFIYPINNYSYDIFIERYISNEKDINKLGQFENLINYLIKLK